MGAQNEWDADLDIDVELAGQLIVEQFPDLAGLPVERFGEGFDNLVVRVADSLFRFPRRRIAVPWIEREIALLPRLAPHLPLAVPRPERVGRPSDDYPVAFYGHPLLPGTTACRADPDDESRTRAAPALGRFLATLHQTDPAIPRSAGLGPDEIRRTDVELRYGRAAERLRRLHGGPLQDRAEHALTLLDEARVRLAPDATATASALRVLVHGDLYPRHLLVDGAHRLTGIIDWGDAHLGDPALDLSIAHTFLPPPAHAAFREAYGPIDGPTWERARYRAVHHTCLVLVYAAVEGEHELLRESLASLTRIEAGLAA